jgi:hypothetical protein
MSTDNFGNTVSEEKLPQNPLNDIAFAQGVVSPIVIANLQQILGINKVEGRSYLSGAQSISTGVATKVNIDTNSFVSNISYDPAAHRFTTRTAGYYFVNAMVGYANYVAGANVVAMIYLNGSQVVYSLGAGFNNGQIATQRVSDLLKLAIGDVVELYTFHNFGSSAPLETGTTITYMSINSA